MHPKHPPICQGAVGTTKTTTKNTSTPMGTINGHSPHPTHTRMWVGCVFSLGLGVGVGCFHCHPRLCC